jgi:NACHT domain- and WD repeat-containing protein
MGRDEERYSVSHSEEITCFALTNDSQHVITGSKDMSLKVWQLAGGKLAQVLVGHTDHVSCIAANKDLVVSGSRDANLIVWDIKTGSDLHTLTAHLSYVTSVQISADGTLAVSGQFISLVFKIT